MSLRRPDAAAMQNQQVLLEVLNGFYEELVKLGKARPAFTVPALKSITLATFADLRNVVGDLEGEVGPRGVIVTGRDAPEDGLQGVFIWVPTSTAPDDNATTIKPTAVTGAGRWRGI